LHPTIKLRPVVLTLVLAATAVPIELRAPNHVTLDFNFFASDVLANIAGYVPAGIVLWALGPGVALLAAGSISVFAEALQFVMMHRDPSVADVVSNVAGAALGLALCRYWGIRAIAFRLTRWRAIAASILAVTLVAGVRLTSGYAPSPRGSTLPGTLEAHWNFDETEGQTAFDSAGHGLHGRFSREPKRVAGALGGAVALDGVSDYIDFGRSTALRLSGSMTLSAWIKATKFPWDDAAIVSSHDGLGYQLDTTIDRGPRTIGFKLATSCGELMARYGHTPLVTGRWYHVAGVYDSEHETLDVYLNGQPDNGFLLGPVTKGQRSSNRSVYVGRRSGGKGYEFAGSIDDVRIYSRPLTRAEIVADMKGAEVQARPQGQFVQPTTGTSGRRLSIRCGAQSDLEDARLPAAAGVLGALIAIAGVTLWPSAAWPLWLGASFAAAFLLFPATAPALPALAYWMVPLTSLAGAASVAAGLSGRSSRT
jgi:hypothetical protein